MIRHTFKMVWNRKRRSMLLMSEILLSFVVLFCVASAVITGVTRYLQPLGFSYEDRWMLNIQRTGNVIEEDEDVPEARARLKRVRDELLAQPAVEAVSFFSSNSPYSHSTWSTGFDWNESNYHAWIWLADDEFAKVAGVTLLEGRWFSPEDDATTQRAIVLTRKMKEDLFGDESPVGKVQIDKEDQSERVIVGVIDDYRYKGEFEHFEGGFFERHALSDTSAGLTSRALFTVRDGSDARVEEAILKRLSAIVPDWTLRIERLVDARASYIKDNLLGAGVFVAIAGFLIINVALGLFGVLWQSVNRRHGEIGLRRAVGASAGNISIQVLMESLVLATLAIGAGILVAIQIPILGIDRLALDRGSIVPDGTYVLAVVCGALWIYLLVVFCAFYPSRLAARVQPAAALHDE